MTTLEQMAKAAYDRIGAVFAEKGYYHQPWESLCEAAKDHFRAAIRAAMAVKPPDWVLDDEWGVEILRQAEVKPDAVTQE